MVALVPLRCAAALNAWPDLAARLPPLRVARGGAPTPHLAHPRTHLSSPFTPIVIAPSPPVRHARAQAAFGTESNPVKVPSAFNERVVGCTGGVEGGNKHHEVQWFNLKAGAIHKVMPSGQCFVLVKPEDM